MPTNLFTDDLEALTNEELFAAIIDFAKLQPIEGWRHDYTEKWEDAGLKNIAAFANTFGGLLIVGVKKGKKDVACEFPGVETDSEYKTRIASAIAANISPVPTYSVVECHQPGASNRKFCVVRVREGRQLHLITKKDLNPAYVRNEDESRIADATQLRRLIDREKNLPSVSDRIITDANRLRDSMLINSSYQNPDSNTWHLSPHNQSQTSLKLELVPAEITRTELEQSHENRLRKLISALYPRVGDTVFQGVAKQAESRGADFYEFIYYHKNLKYEIRWRITSTGAIGFAAQMHYQSEVTAKVWSIVDVANYLVLFFKLGMKSWESIGYFGDGNFLSNSPSTAWTYSSIPITVTVFKALTLPFLPAVACDFGNRLTSEVMRYGSRHQKATPRMHRLVSIISVPLRIYRNLLRPSSINYCGHSVTAQTGTF